MWISRSVMASIFMMAFRRTIHHGGTETRREHFYSLCLRASVVITLPRRTTTSHPNVLTGTCHCLLSRARSPALSVPVGKLAGRTIHHGGTETRREHFY